LVKPAHDPLLSQPVPGQVALQLTQERGAEHVHLRAVIEQVVRDLGPA